MNQNFELFIWIIIASFFIQIILFVASYLTIRKTHGDLYHILFEESEKQKSEDLENQRKKITEIYKTQLDIRQTKQALQQASNSESIDRVKIQQILDKLQEDYTSSNLSTIADLEGRQGNYEKALDYINKAIELDYENPELWKMKGNYLNALDRTVEEQEAKKRYTEFLAISNFKKNLKRPIVLEEIQINNLPFYGSFVWKLEPRINVLLGKNGYGKSHLLSIILAQLQEETTALVDLSKISAQDSSAGRCFIKITMDSGEAPFVEIINLKKEISDLVKQSQKFKQPLSISEIKIEPSFNEPGSDKASTVLQKIERKLSEKKEQLEKLTAKSLFEKTGGIQSTNGKIPVLAIPDLRFINKSTETTQVISDDRAKKLLEYGAHHFISQSPYENAIQNFLNTICIIYYSSGTFKDEIFQLINRVFKALSGSQFDWVDINPTQDNSGNIIRVRTDGNNQPLPIQKISQGTLSILSIIGLIFHYLSLRYPEVERMELSKKQAIIFIDEIDAHLHPSWQQKLIGILRREFPNIQFIITAHSPLIVAGCKEDEVAVMRELKSEDQFVKGFVVEKLFQDFIGYPIDELYKRIFEIENKDETYLRYLALIPGKSEIEAEVKKLEEEREKQGLKPDKLSKLIELTDELYYIEKAKHRMESTVDVDQIKVENQMLKMELELERSSSLKK